MSTSQARQPKGIPTGGQFAGSRRGEAAVSLVTIPAQRIEVQAEPLLADNAMLSSLAADGTITSVVAISTDEWDGCSDGDARADLLARAQVAHVQPYWLCHKVLAVHDDQMLVEVTNNLHTWTHEDEGAVDDYNAAVEPGFAITPEKYAWLRASGHTAANGHRAVYDLDNYQVVWTDDGPARVTACCGASATGTADYIGCRSCYEPVDDAIGMPARLVPQHAPAVSWGSTAVQEDEQEKVQSAIDDALRAVMFYNRLVTPRRWEDQVVVIGEDGIAEFYRDSAWAPGSDAPRGRVVARVGHDGHVDVSHVRLGLTGLRQRVDGRFEHNGSLRQDRHQCTRPNTGATCVLMKGHPDDCAPTLERS